MSTSAGSTSQGGDDFDTRHDDIRQDGSSRGSGTRREVVARQKEEHGGVKIGSAFFGFLTAVGVGVLLTALVSAAGAAVGLASDAKPSAVASAATKSVETVSIVGGIVLLLILFVAYYCGGYVASRMARFNGMKQGAAVWVWALVITIAVAVLGAVAGDKFNILAQLNSFPRIPVSEGSLTTGGIIAAVAAVLVTLAGAILGGLAGMRFHRTVDRTGLGR
jgi:hypothetical protein